MITLTPAEATAALGVEVTNHEITGVSTDSRTIACGDLFIALRGEQFDGHRFVPAALSGGAVAAVVEEGYVAAEGLEPKLIRVPDPLAALGRLARAVRRKSGATVIAVTGSVGKTSTKDLLKALIASASPVIATASNQNNEVGVPLTLLALDTSVEAVIVEMGMRGSGQIRELAKIAEPDIGLITNVEPVHLELVGTLEEVARAKAELLEALRPGGVAVVPAASGLLNLYVLACEARGVEVVRFSFFGTLPGKEADTGAARPDADITGEVQSKSPEGTRMLMRWPQGVKEVEVPFGSRHLLRNSVAAAAACYAAGFPLEECLDGLQQPVLTPLRGEEIEVGGILILNDTYNANPAAMSSALGTLMDRAKDRNGRPVAVLGDMLELGSESRRFHREAGEYASAVGVELLWAIGDLAEGIAEGFDAKSKLEVDCGGTAAGNPGERIARRSPSVEQAVDGLMRDLRVGDVVLVKASRGMRMERVVEHISRGLKREPPSLAPTIGPV